MAVDIGGWVVVDIGLVKEMVMGTQNRGIQGRTKTRASMKVNPDPTQLNAQQNKLTMLKQQDEILKTGDNEGESIRNTQRNHT